MASIPALPSQLFIATPSAIHLYSAPSKKPLFECQTPGGILNARAAKDNSGLIAVADAQLVLLHDSKRENEREYKLKSGDGEPRLLLFSPDSRVLYFTTTLSPTIQAYSIVTAELLAPPQIHPSPPNVLSISKDGNVLLSASSKPPTIFIQDLRVEGSAPVHFHPTDAKSPVACSAFHTYSNDSKSSSSSSVFLLGFQDGTLAVYKLILPPLSSRRRSSYISRDTPPGFSLQPTKLGAVRKLHKAAMGGISAAEFLPGFRSRVVSIGYDGRCRLVDFEDGTKVLRTWHVSGPATCLSVISTSPVYTKGRKHREVTLSGDAPADETPVYEGTETLIAVGTQAGRVLVFNVLGLLVHELLVEAPVISLECVGDMSAPSILPNHRPGSAPLSPILETLLGTEIDVENSATVKKTRSPPNGPPHRFERTPDLFSDSQPERRMSGALRSPSDISFGSPQQQCHPTAPRRKSYPRPRIVTDTFQIPSPVASPLSSPVLSTQSKTSTPAAKTPPPRLGALKMRGISASRPVEYSPSDYSQPSSSASPDPEAQRSDDEDETFLTPPSTQRVRSPFQQNLINRATTVGMDAKRTGSGMKSPVMSGATNASKGKGKAKAKESERHVNFPALARSSPKLVDGQVDLVSRDGRRGSGSGSGSRTVSIEEAAREVRRRSALLGADFPDPRDGSGDRDVVKRERDELREETEGLRREMRDLRREFKLLRDAVLEGRRRDFG